MERVSFLKPYVKEAAVIIEAGCADGTDTLNLANAFPSAKIYAFEPVPALFARARQKVQLHANVECIPMALNVANTNVTLHLSSRGDEVFCSSSIFRPKEHLTLHPEIKFETEIQVPAINLDTFCASRHIQPDVLFLDMQGAEMSILMSSPATLSHVKAIYTEVSLMQMYENAPLYPEVKSFLTARGFSVVMEDLPWRDMGNVLFARQ